MSANARLRKRRGAGGESSFGPGRGSSPLVEEWPRKSRLARIEIRPAAYITLLRHRHSVGGDRIVLMQSGDHFLAADDDAQIVADEFGSPLYTCDCDGLRVRVTAIEPSDIDAVMVELRSAGHGVAIAAQFTDPDSSGYAQTAVVRNYRPRFVDTSGSSFVCTNEVMRGLAARVQSRVEDLCHDMRPIAIRTIKAWLDDLVSEQDRRGHTAVSSGAPWRETLTPWHLIEEMAEAMAPLSEENQRHAVRMVRWFGELISTHTGVTDEPCDLGAGTVEPGPRLLINLVDGSAIAS